MAVKFTNLQLFVLGGITPAPSINVAQTGYNVDTTITNTFNFTTPIGSGDASRTIFFLINAGRNTSDVFSISNITVDGVAPVELASIFNPNILLAAYAIKASDLSNPNETTASVAITISSSINRGVAVFTVATPDDVSLTPYSANSAFTNAEVTLSNENDMNVNTINGAAILGWCGAYADNTDSNKNYAWVGLTETDEQQYGSPGRRIGLALASNVASESPRTISVTGTVTDDPANFGQFASAAIVLVPNGI